MSFLNFGVEIWSESSKEREQSNKVYLLNKKPPGLGSEWKLIHFLKFCSTKVVLTLNITAVTNVIQ